MLPPLTSSNRVLRANREMEEQNEAEGSGKPKSAKPRAPLVHVPVVCLATSVNVNGVTLQVHLYQDGNCGKLRNRVDLRSQEFANVMSYLVHKRDASVLRYIGIFAIATTGYCSCDIDVNKVQ